MSTISGNLLPVTNTGPVQLSNPISSLTSTLAGGIAGGIVGSVGAKKLVRSYAGTTFGGALTLALGVAGGIAGAGLGGIVGARLGADMPAPAVTGAAVLAGAASGAMVGAVTKRLPISMGIAAGTAAGLVAARLHGPEEAAPLNVVSNVDLTQYAGQWYEITRLPTSFQDPRTVSTATYSANGDGSVKVLNTSFLNGKESASIEGSAVPVDAANNRLQVGFGGFLRLIPKSDEGNYWILGLTDDYSTALVGSPDRSTLWLLARDKYAAGSETAHRMLEQARAQGYKVDDMVVADWDRQEIRTS